MMRPALYSSQYAPGMDYSPSENIGKWIQRWRMVQVRQIFALGLQSLWGAFILILRDREYGITLDEFFEHIFSLEDVESKNLIWRVLEINLHKKSVFLMIGKQLSGNSKPKVSLKANLMNLVYTSNDLSISKYRDPGILIRNGFEDLSQLFMRFYGWYQNQDDIWLELASQERLPMTQFFEDNDCLKNQSRENLQGLADLAIP